MGLISQESNVVVSKYWGPFVCILFSCVAISWQGLPNRSLFLAAPFLIAAFFGASLAVIDIRDGVLYYRRALTWTMVPSSEIVSGRVEWPPFIGSIRLRKRVAPWGRLYFVLDAGLRSGLLKRGEYASLQLINKASASRPSQPISHPHSK